MEEPKLCYVEGRMAYFTTRELDKQWGDDWNDAPYEHNAGTPYHDRQNNPPQWVISTIMFDSNMETPADIAACNSPFSVEQINAGITPWLVNRFEKPYRKIFAGVTPDEFMDTIEADGGIVYVPRKATSGN